MQCVFCTQESRVQTRSRCVQPFLHSAAVWVTNRPPTPRYRIIGHNRRHRICSKNCEAQLTTRPADIYIRDKELRSVSWAPTKLLKSVRSSYIYCFLESLFSLVRCCIIRHNRRIIASLKMFCFSLRSEERRQTEPCVSCRKRLTDSKVGRIVIV